MKRSMKTTIVSLAMCALLACSATPAFAASSYTPNNVTGSYTENAYPNADGFLDDTPFKEFESSASEIRLMDGQSYDFYVSGASMTESDAAKMRYYSKDSNVATVQYVGFDPIKGFQFRITANLKGTPKEAIPTGEAKTSIGVEHKGSGGGGCDVIVSKKGALGLSTTDVMMIGKPGGSTYDFYVLGVNDTSKIKVASNNTNVATVQLVDANDPRGAKYRITAKPTGNSAIKGAMGTKIAYIDVEYNGQKRDIRVLDYSVAGSIMVDTTSYTMPTKGGTYQIGLTIKDGDGNKLEPKEIKWLLDAEILKVRDSRTGSIVDLVQLENGNFRVNAKKAGSTYILFEINDCHTSLRVDVKDNAKAGGAATRDTIYWGFTTDTQPVRFKAQSHYYRNSDGSWNEQAIINDMTAIGEQMRMKYEPRATVENSGYYPADNINAFGNRTGSDYLQTGFYTWKDSDAYALQNLCFDSIETVSDGTRFRGGDGSEKGQTFRPYFTEDSRYPGEYLLYVVYGSNVQN